MSHFTVLVVGEDIEKQMLPFCEHSETTDEYHVFKDTEDENREEYLTGSMDAVKTPLGWASKWDNQFRNPDYWRNFSAGGKTSEYIWPSEPVPVPFTDVYPSFEDFMKGWHGHDSRDEKMNRYGYWRNPNAKWDWYSVGGRWKGFFKLKPNATGEMGRSGAFDNEATFDADSTLKGNIDFEGMVAHVRKEATETADKVYEGCKHLPFPKKWDEVLTMFPEKIDEARSFYHAQPAIAGLSEALGGGHIWNPDGFLPGEDWESNRTLYIERAATSSYLPYAILYNGSWMGRGEMGWFGCSHDEMDENQWNQNAKEFIDNLPASTKLTLLDCHI